MPALRKRSSKSPARKPGGGLVVILRGSVPPDAPDDEQDVIVEARFVEEALKRLGYDVEEVEFTLDLEAAAKRVRSLKPLAVFNLVESVEGRSRFISMAPALLCHLGVPYTGNSLHAIAATTNKVMAKQIMSGAGIQTPAWITDREVMGGEGRMSFPAIVKPAWEHASVGLDGKSIVASRSELVHEVGQRTKELKEQLFAEAFVDGREFNISIIDGPGGAPEILPIAEMVFKDFGKDRPRIVCYRAKWDEEAFEFQNTVRSFEYSRKDAALLKRLKEVALRCWSVFELGGYARVDVRVDAAGTPFVLEVNTNPCISPDGGFHAAVQRAGLDIKDIVARLVERAVLNQNR